jgi:hypothetical protein
MPYKEKLPKVKEQKTYAIENKNESEYDKQANKFLKDTNTKFSIKYIKHDKYFPDDKEARDIYRFKFVKDGKVYSGTFGQSINGSFKKEIPSAYDVLSSMTKSDVYSFEEFTSEYGYNSEEKSSKKIYKAVQKERENLKRLYSEEELNQLADIN